jgi:hypothetical protein
MNSVETRHAMLRDFALCVDNASLPPLRGYLTDYVKSGCAVEPEDFRLLPLTPSIIRFANTASDCLTDCLLDLQAKYRQFVPDDWGGHFVKGSRDLGVIGFNILEGVVLDIREINPTSSYEEWAAPMLDALDWQGLLVHAVVDFGRCCQARQIRLQPEHERVAEASGFVRDTETAGFVLNLTAT